MYKNGERMMAWVSKIAEIKSIPNADRIVAYRVGGWWVVDQKDRYQIDDLVVYVSIDAWVPHDVAPFLSKDINLSRTYNGVRGERLRTIRLRGQVSQGLLLSGTHCPTGLMVHRPDSMAHIFQEGDNVSDWLNIQKWEAPIPAHLSGKVKGLFPSFVPKTDQERIQNLNDELQQWRQSNLTWEVSEKLDGSSMTVYHFQGEVGVCSRNYELQDDDSTTFWRVAKSSNLIENLRNFNKNIALQGELIGEGIQGNPYRLKGQYFYLYDIYDIDLGQYVTAENRTNWIKDLGVSHVPIIVTDSDLSDLDTLLKRAEGKSQLCSVSEREGIVYKCNQHPELHFKVISNRFLTKNNG